MADERKRNILFALDAAVHQAARAQAAEAGLKFGAWLQRAVQEKVQKEEVQSAGRVRQHHER